MKQRELLVAAQALSVEFDGNTCVANGRRSDVEVAELGRGDYSVILDGKHYLVHLAATGDGTFESTVDGARFAVEARDPRQLPRDRADAGGSGASELRAAMPGKILAVCAAEGDRVQSGQGLVVIEAMKMQNELRAPRDGRIAAVRVAAGDSVAAGATLISIE